MVGMFAASFAQTGAVIGMYLKTREKRLKALCVPAIISGMAGVTEPAIYGITLPKKKPFAITCVIAAITGGILTALGAKYYMVPGMGVFGYTAFVNTAASDLSGMFQAIAVSAASLAAGIVVIYLTYKDEAPKDKKTVEGLNEAAGECRKRNFPCSRSDFRPGYRPCHPVKPGGGRSVFQWSSGAGSRNPAGGRAAVRPGGRGK